MPRKIPKIVREIQKNPPEKVDYSYQKNISYSQLSIYNGCPFRWKLQYKDKKRKFTSSIHTVFGTALHEVIQNYLDVMYSQSGAAADRLQLDFRFQKTFIEEYQKQYKKNKNTHFSSAEEMREFYEDGVEILKFFKKNRAKYFSRRGTYLVGCEVPLNIAPNPIKPNLIFTAYLDVVIYEEAIDKFTILDIKTSTSGWKDYQKKDENKINQLILYKKFFSEQYNIPLEKIKVEFFITKRKIWEDSPYPIPRIQEFKPADGKIKLNNATQNLNKFLTECFNNQGKIKDIEYPKQPSKWNCKFCPYADDDDLCGKGKHFL